MRRLVVVMGMHRSGTSALAGALNRLGWSSGPLDNLLPSANDNVKGFYESRRLVELNERLLAEVVHKSLKDVFPFAPDDMVYDRFGWVFGALGVNMEAEGFSLSDELLLSMCHFMNDLFRRCENDGVILLKDPRLSLTYEWWQEFFPKNHKVVVLVRHPCAVASSLNKRNSISGVSASFLWLLYNKSWMRSLNGREFELVVCDQLRDDPKRVIESVARFVCGKCYGSLDIEAAVNFIDPGLFNCSENGIVLPSRLRYELCCIYEALVNEAFADCLDMIDRVVESALGWVDWYDILGSALVQVSLDESKRLRIQLNRIGNHPVFGRAIHLWRSLINKNYNVLDG